MAYDIEKIREAYHKSKGRSEAERTTYERLWFRNVLYLLGIQWIVYRAETRTWRPRVTKKWVPRPVTNKFAGFCNTILQTLSARMPEAVCTPATDDPDDVGAAETSLAAMPVIYEEVNAEQARRETASWLVLTGNAFLHPSIDNDPKHGTSFVQHVTCNDCGKMFPPDQAGSPVDLPQPPPLSMDAGMPMGEAMGAAPSEPVGMEGPEGALPTQGAGFGDMIGETPTGPALGQIPPEAPPEPELLSYGPSSMPQFGAPPQRKSEVSCPFCGSPNVIPAQDDAGSPVGEELANGKLRLEVFSPFEVFLDLEARSMDDVEELLVRRRYPVERIRTLYNRPELEADTSSTTGGANFGLNLLRSIAYAVGDSDGRSVVSKGGPDDQGITIDYFWKRPCIDFQEGVVAVFANDQLLNTDTVEDGIPYRDTKNRPIWPWHHVVFDSVPGRLLGRTPMDDVAPKQEQRNKLESLIQLIISRTANPVWLIPKNLGVSEITGEPGELVEGNWAIDPRLRPERVPGENIPTSLIAWLEKLDRDMEELAGVFEVMKGSAPPGVTAGTALRLLLERANTRFTPVLMNIERLWGKVSKDLLTIAQQFWSEERINTIKGQGATWEVQRFSKADIRGSVDVRVEAGSAVPKTQVGQQALVQDLTAMGVINPQMPETQYKILNMFSSTSLLGSMDQNRKQAQRENWKFINEKVRPKVNPIIDDNVVHLTVHREYALTSEFEMLPEEMKRLWMIHILEHQMAMMPQMQEPMEQGPGESGGKKERAPAGPESTGANTQMPPTPGGPM
jgi:hypothetical protein